MVSDITSYLRDLVAFETVTSNAAANETALNYLEHYFSTHGLFCKRFNHLGHGALVASSRDGNAKHPVVLLAAHVDVVAGESSQFTLREEQGKLFGRGVFDMKFALAGYMQLVQELGTTVPDYDFAIMITSDEEVFGLSTKHLMESGYRPDVCILPDSAAAGWDIEKLAKGVWRFELGASGRAAHSSRPWEGDSASIKLVECLNELKALFQGQGPLTNTLNIAAISGGNEYNLIPDTMTARIEVRFMAEASRAELERQVKGLCIRHGVAYSVGKVDAPTITDLTNPYVEAYSTCVEAIIGRHPEGVVSFGSSDAEFFAERNVPCIVSCVEGGKHHSIDEWIRKSSLEQFVPILRSYLETIAYGDNKKAQKTEASNRNI
jgi:succinyl-diaminopimelate desuccinylase